MDALHVSMIVLFLKCSARVIDHKSACSVAGGSPQIFPGGRASGPQPKIFLDILSQGGLWRRLCLAISMHTCIWQMVFPSRGRCQLCQDFRSKEESLQVSPESSMNGCNRLLFLLTLGRDKQCNFGIMQLPQPELHISSGLT